MGADGRQRRTQSESAQVPRAPDTASDPALLRAGGTCDAPAVAALHAGQIEDGFLSFLGPGFLARLYRRIAVDAASFLVVAEESGRPVGFVAGTADLRGLYRRFIVRDGAAAAMAAAPRLVRGWQRALETLRHGAGAASGPGAMSGYELLAIAVHPAVRGGGIGGRLVTAFCNEVVERGGATAHVVVGAANLAAFRLYERSGFVVAEEFELHAGTASLVMQWPAGEAGRSDGPAGAGG